MSAVRAGWQGVVQRPAQRRRWCLGLVVLVSVALALVCLWASSALAAPALGLQSQVLPTFDGGHYHSLAIKADGSLWAWGRNKYAQLGDGTELDRYQPVRVGTDNDWVTVAAGGFHSLAIMADGSLWAWGANSCGELGDGSTIDRLEPVRIGMETDWVSVSGGLYHTLALKADGSLWAWGYNEFGQVGDGSTIDRVIPTRIGDDTDWVAIAAGSYHSLALRADGTLWIWGQNNRGQLGNGFDDDLHEPDLNTFVPSVAALAAGEQHSHALTADGRLFCAGNDTYGQWGGAARTWKMGVAGAGTRDWAAVACGGFHSLALKSTGTLWAWGLNDHGQVGDHTFVDKHEVTQIGAKDDWVAVAGGGSHSLALDEGGTLAAWGNNKYGQVGDGTTTDRSAPVLALTGVKMPMSIDEAYGGSPGGDGGDGGGGPGDGGGGITFSDVSEEYPYHDAIYHLAGLGIITGYDDGTYRPFADVTRQQFAKMIVKTLGYPVTGSEVCPFTDVAAQMGADPFYPSKYVAVCASHGVTVGKTPTTFAPDDTITHQQLITMIARAAGLSNPPLDYLPTFIPAQFSLLDHYQNARKAAYAGLLDGLQGVGPDYDFLAPSTRGQCAQLLHNLLEM